VAAAIVGCIDPVAAVAAPQKILIKPTHGVVIVYSILELVLMQFTLPTCGFVKKTVYDIHW
jgi:hypothetical protein